MVVQTFCEMANVPNQTRLVSSAADKTPPQTTPLAANVLFGYWSHDVGGFHTGNGAPGDADPRNYTVCGL